MWRKSDLISSLSDVGRAFFRLRHNVAKCAISLSLFIGVRSLSASLPASGEPQTFRLSVSQELGSLDPVDAHSSLSSYLLNSLHITLMQYQNQQLVPYGAQACVKKGSQHYQCLLRDDWRWSDGEKVTAEQFVENWSFMQKNSSLRLDDFQSLKTVSAPRPNIVDFFLREPDSEFLYRLIDPSMLPRRTGMQWNEPFKQGRLTAGVYSIKNYRQGRSYELVPNPYFFIKNHKRPHVEFLLVDSDHTTLALFQTQKINFVRRLTADQLPQYKDHPGLKVIPLHRMDYVGFGAGVTATPGLAEKLIYSLQPLFPEFQKIFMAKAPPGCLALRTPEVTRPICYKSRKWRSETFDSSKLTTKLQLYYATQAGEDIRRGMELFQNGWKKNLGLEVELESREWGVLNAQLKKEPPPLFRRGVPLFRPTCLAALEIFASDSPDNWVKVKSKKIDLLISQLRKVANPKLCQKGLELVLEAHRIIPLGPIHFTALSDNKFDGILINELNQIDLSRLTPKE